MASNALKSERLRKSPLRLSCLGFTLLDLVSEVSEAVLSPLLLIGPFQRPFKQPAHSTVSIVLRRFPNLIRLFRSAVGSSQSDELISILNSLTDNRDQIQRAVVVWLDLIEVLVQQSERHYGSKPGMGQIKTREVKQTLAYLIRSGRFSLPQVPQPLGGLLIAEVAGWAIDVVVLQANQYSLWAVEAQQESALSQIWARVKRALSALVIAIGDFLAKIFVWLRELFQSTPSISPALKGALDAVEREGVITREQSIIVSASRLFIWLGTHRTELVQATQIVFGAVQEAETLLTMSGPEKKQFARDLIWCVLEEMGFTPQSGILQAAMDSIIDLLIETSVHFFNKRAKFVHHNTPVAATGEAERPSTPGSAVSALSRFPA